MLPIDEEIHTWDLKIKPYKSMKMGRKVNIWVLTLAREHNIFRDFKDQKV